MDLQARGDFGCGRAFAVRRTEAILGIATNGRNQKVLNCPACGAKQSLLRLRPEFQCASCHEKLRSNSLGLGMIGLIVSFLPSFLWFDGWLGSVALAAVLVLVLTPFVRITLAGGRD